jgi:hypothetical protein
MGLWRHTGEPIDPSEPYHSHFGLALALCWRKQVGAVIGQFPRALLIAEGVYHDSIRRLRFEADGKVLREENALTRPVWSRLVRLRVASIGIL